MGVPDSREVTGVNPKRRGLVIADFGRASPGGDTYERVVTNEDPIASVAAEPSHRINEYIRALTSRQAVPSITIAGTGIEDDAATAVDVDPVAVGIRDIKAVHINILRIVYVEISIEICRLSEGRA